MMLILESLNQWAGFLLPIFCLVLNLCTNLIFFLLRVRGFVRTSCMILKITMNCSLFLKMLFEFDVQLTVGGIQDYSVMHVGF